jgi:hypothetical protein
MLLNPEIKEAVKQELSGENAKNYVQQICQFHRIQASPMFHKAAEYVRDTLAKMGFENARIEQFPADGETKYWTYTAPLGWEAKKAELWLVEPEEKLLARYQETLTCLHVHSKATPPEGITASLVDVGTGTKPADYKGKRVKGKFVLATGRAKHVHEEAVFRRKAVGVITDTLTHEIEGFRQSIDLPDATAYQAIWPTKKEMNKVTFGFSITKRQGNYLRSLLKQKKKVVLKAIVDAKLFRSKLDIVTATIKGKTKPSQEIFMIAHLCHPQPSANDNASGSGLLLEIARTIKTLIRKGRIPQPKRTIRFLWVPEIYGTIAYLHKHQNLTKRLMAGINLDMVGQDQERCKSTLTIDKTPDSLPSYLNDLLLTVTEETTKLFDPETGFGPAATFRYRVNTHTGGSDHHEFVDSTIKVPCVMLLQWPDLYYHTSQDTIDKVSAPMLKRIGWIATTSALTLANANAEEAYTLATLTYTNGVARLQTALKEAIQTLLKTKNNPKCKAKPKKMATTIARTAWQHRNKIEHIARREKEAIKSVQAITSDTEVTNLTNQLIKQLDIQAEWALNQIQRTLQLIEKALNIKIPKRPPLTQIEKQISKTIVKRQFKGSLSGEMLSKKVFAPKDYEWYVEVCRKDKQFNQKIAETLNLADGKRTLKEIINIVSAEYTPTNAKHILKILQHLEKRGFVTMKTAAD